MTRGEKLKLIYSNAYQAEIRMEENENPWSCLTLESKVFDQAVINAFKGVKDFDLLTFLAKNIKL